MDAMLRRALSVPIPQRLANVSGLRWAPLSGALQDSGLVRNLFGPGLRERKLTQPSRAGRLGSVIATRVPSPRGTLQGPAAAQLRAGTVAGPVFASSRTALTTGDDCVRQECSGASLADKPLGGGHRCDGWVS